MSFAPTMMNFALNNDGLNTNVQLIPPSGGALTDSDEIWVSVNDTVVTLTDKTDVTLKDLTLAYCELQYNNNNINQNNNNNINHNNSNNDNNNNNDINAVLFFAIFLSKMQTERRITPETR